MYRDSAAQARYRRAKAPPRRLPAEPRPPSRDNRTDAANKTLLRRAPARGIRDFSKKAAEFPRGFSQRQRAKTTLPQVRDQMEKSPLRRTQPPRASISAAITPPRQRGIPAPGHGETRQREGRDEGTDKENKGGQGKPKRSPGQRARFSTGRTPEGGVHSQTSAAPEGPQERHQLFSSPYTPPPYSSRDASRSRTC